MFIKKQTVTLCPSTRHRHVSIVIHWLISSLYLSISKKSFYQDRITNEKLFRRCKNVNFVWLFQEKYSLLQNTFLLKQVNTNSKTNMEVRVDKRMRWIVKTAMVKAGSKEFGHKRRISKTSVERGVEGQRAVFYILARRYKGREEWKSKGSSKSMEWNMALHLYKGKLEM